LFFGKMNHTMREIIAKPNHDLFFFNIKSRLGLEGSFWKVKLCNAVNNF
jgi:hypothetical protein